MSRPHAPEKCGRRPPILCAAICLGLLLVVGCGEHAHDATRAFKRTREVRDPKPSCDLHATPATFESVVSGAVSGQTVCLGAGVYGTWTGTTKAITIAPEPSVSPSLNFAFGPNAANFTINGGHTNYDSNSPGINLINANSLDNGAKNITLENLAVTCNIPNGACLEDDSNDAVTISHNVFHDMLYPNSTGAALRVYSEGGSGNVTYNLFRDMGAHAIEATGATVVGNDFLDVTGANPNDPRHTDAIYWTSPGDVIKGNYINGGCTQGFGAFDGTSGNTMEDNVVVGCSAHSLALFGDNPGSLVAHNTVVGGNFECPSKSGSPASTTSIQDNVFQYGIDGSGAVTCTPTVDSDNMSWPSFGQMHSASDFIGAPGFAGGSSPNTYAGYALAAGSPGKGKASDGGDVGARVQLYARPPGLL